MWIDAFSYCIEYNLLNCSRLVANSNRLPLLQMMSNHLSLACLIYPGNLDLYYV